MASLLDSQPAFENRAKEHGLPEDLIADLVRRGVNTLNKAAYLVLRSLRRTYVSLPILQPLRRSRMVFLLPFAGSCSKVRRCRLLTFANRLR